MSTMFKLPAKARTIGSAKMDGIAHLSRPGFDIWCLSDGAYVFDTAVFPSVGGDVRDARLETAGQTQIDTVFHAYLIKPATSGFVLFDTGCGSAFGDIAGFLPQRLAALDVDVDQIETLVFSHLHSDHCGGAVIGDAPVFANADVKLHTDEPAVWDGGDFAANKVLAAYGGWLSTVTDGQDIAPGITAWGLPGHTAGHMGLRIGEGVVLCADILHSDALQLPDPSVASIYDDDPDRARLTRELALTEITERRLIFSGSHGCHMDKFRKLRRLGTGYEAIPL